MFDKMRLNICVVLLSILQITMSIILLFMRQIQKPYVSLCMSLNEGATIILIEKKNWIEVQGESHYKSNF